VRNAPPDWRVGLFGYGPNHDVGRAASVSREARRAALRRRFAAGERALLQARIKDLKLHLAGTPLERYIQQLYAELDAKGLALRPECYLSDQWGCPSGVPVIRDSVLPGGPTLHSIEEALAAGSRRARRDHDGPCVHEAGHVFNYAVQALRDRKSGARPSVTYTKAATATTTSRLPFSRKYVVHSRLVRAEAPRRKTRRQTFGSGLTAPTANWAAAGTKGLGALKKLPIRAWRRGRAAPCCLLPSRSTGARIDVDQMKSGARALPAANLEEKSDVHLGEHLDGRSHRAVRTVRTPRPRAATTMIRF